MLEVLKVNQGKVAVSYKFNPVMKDVINKGIDWIKARGYGEVSQSDYVEALITAGLTNQEAYISAGGEYLNLKDIYLDMSENIVLSIASYVKEKKYDKKTYYIKHVQTVTESLGFISGMEFIVYVDRIFGTTYHKRIRELFEA